MAMLPPPIDKCNLVHAAIRKSGLVELNNSADLPLSDSYLFSKWKKFLSDKNFSHDDERIDTVEEYLNKSFLYRHRKFA